MNTLEQIANDLAQIKTLLQTLVQFNAPQSPNYRYPLAAYQNFEWSSIGANVISRDRHGVTAVNWGGYTWKRRSDNSKKRGKAVWFSRPLADAENQDYACLVRFSDLAQVEPMSFDLPEIGDNSPISIDAILSNEFPQLDQKSAEKLRIQITGSENFHISQQNAIILAVRDYVGWRRTHESDISALEAHKKAKNAAIARFRAEIAKN